MDQLTRTPVEVDSLAPVQEPAGKRGRRRRIPRMGRRTTIALLIFVVLVPAAVGFQLTAEDDAPETTGAAAPASTTQVKSRDLIVTEDVKGDLGYADGRDLSAQREGIVTSLAALGSTVKQGRELYEINRKPTVLLTGKVPAYRTLDVDSSNGDDVRQLERALKDLGYGDDLTVDRNFTGATADAVEEWEDDLGRNDPDGKVQLGDVVFAPGPVRIAALPVSVGTQVQATTAILSVSSTDKVADVDLDSGKANLVAPKDAVTVELPNGKDTPGKVASVGTETQSSDPDADPTVPMVVRLNRPKDAAAFDSGSVTVSIEQSRDEDVLSVPVTALIALAEGGYAVQVVDPAAASGYRLLAVKTGTLTEDYAGISGDGIVEGLEVVVAT
jgi:multidrug efflux system membrane fusion protein